MKNTKLIALLVCLTMVVCSFAACDLSTLPVIGSMFVKTAAIEFNVGDGELVGEAPASYSDNAALALPTANLQYYAFKGWSLNADGSGDLYTEIPVKYALTEDQIADETMKQKDMLFESYAAAGINASSMEKMTVTFLGEERAALHTSATVQGVPYYILQFFDFDLGSYTVTTTLASYQELQRDLLYAFRKLGLNGEVQNG